MSRLIVSETEDQVQLRWLGLHVAFAKDASLPPRWRDVVRQPRHEAAIYDWLASFGHLDAPGEALPGAALQHMVEGRSLALAAA